MKKKIVCSVCGEIIEIDDEQDLKYAEENIKI